MPMFDCPHCGYSNPDAARFCDQCGTVLSPRPPPAQPVDSPPEVSEDAAQGAGTESARRGDDSGLQDVTPNPAQPAYSRTWPSSPGAEEEADQDADQDESPRPEASQPEPLLDDLPGLLEPADPLAFATAGSGGSQSQRDARHPLPPVENEEERRQLRELFAGDIPLAERAAPDSRQGASENAPVGRGLQRQHWLEWLLLLGLIAALLWDVQSPAAGAGPHALPGLLPAYQQIETLPPNSIVLVNWAYDPATAGEMDLVAQPVIEHLLRRQAKLVVVSQLPGGLATARRLIAKAEETLRRPGRSQLSNNVTIEAGFLPGGAVSLPLLGVAPAQTLPIDPHRVDLKDRFTVAGLDSAPAALNLVIAARAEDVRRWLEQVQPLNNGAVIAVSSAVVDPGLRPYLHSGQLSGLVSGWDGGKAYQRRS